jgi:hypothetical protein
MDDFRQKFGLGYLKGEPSVPSDVPRSAPARTELPSDMEDAIIIYSRPLLDALKNSPDRTSKQFELAKTLKIRVDEIAPVVKYLVGKSYIKVTEPDDLGNDTLALTQEGERLLSPGVRAKRGSSMTFDTDG